VLVTLPAALGSDLILVALVFYSQSDDFPTMSLIDLFDMSAHGSDLGLTFLSSIIVLVTLPATLPRFPSDLGCTCFLLSVR